METQLEWLEEAVRLAKENPERKIRVCAASDELVPEFGWTSHQISRVELGFWYSTGEEIYTELGDIADHMGLSRDDDEPEVTEEEAESAAEKAILIYTNGGS